MQKVISKNEIESILNKIYNIGDDGAFLHIIDPIPYQTAFVHKSYFYELENGTSGSGSGSSACGGSNTNLVNLGRTNGSRRNSNSRDSESSNERGVLAFVPTSSNEVL